MLTFTTDPRSHRFYSSQRVPVYSKELYADIKHSSTPEQLRKIRAPSRTRRPWSLLYANHVLLQGRACILPFRPGL